MDGKKFQEYRKKAGLSQRKIAELLGYSGRGGETTVQNWEYNKQPIPMRHFKKLAELFGISVEEFLP